MYGGGYGGGYGGELDRLTVAFNRTPTELFLPSRSLFQADTVSSRTDNSIDKSIAPEQDGQPNTTPLTKSFILFLKAAAMAKEVGFKLER